MHIRKLITSIFLIVAILALSTLAGFWLWNTRNMPQEKEPEKLVTKVRVITAEKKPFTIYIDSNGRVEPVRKAQIAAELTGVVKSVTENLAVGEVIKKGTIIATIDDADYRTALANAKSAQASASSSIADAQLMLIQEKAMAEKNLREWKRLGKGKPSELVARIPQILSAEARVEAAKASREQAKESIKKAERDVEKTSIIAPYDIKVGQKFIEIGNFVTVGSPLLEGHSAGVLQVRLPVTLNDFSLIKEKSKPIQLITSMSGSTLHWKANFIRSEGTVDQSTLTLPIIAEIQPNMDQPNFQLPPVGLFIDAKIEAEHRESVMLLPRDAVQLADKVHIVDSEQKLRIRPVQVIYTNPDYAIVEGVEAGELIVISPLETPVDGMYVEIATENEQEEQGEMKEGAKPQG